MNRRIALQRVALLAGGLIAAPTLSTLLNGCKSKDSAISNFSFSKVDWSLVDEISEVIIPKTDTPGAKELKVVEILEVLLGDCYSETQQNHFLAGLRTVEEESQKLGGDFVSLSSENKIKVVEIMREKAKEERAANEAKAELEAKSEKNEVKEVDAETGKEKEKAEEEEAPTPFYNLMRDLTIVGYYTSEYGITKAYDYVPVPGKFESCITVQSGQRAYS